MNWLAHLLLSEPTPECWMGNLLPDFLRGSELQVLPTGFSRGIRLHRIIDAFTDTHPVVMRSRRRLPLPYRRYAGIVMDVFYDHLLAAQWQRYATVEIDSFIEQVYAGLKSQCAWIPEHARERLEWMIRSDLLGSYREIEGIRRALERVGKRLRRPVDLGGAVTTLEAEYDALDRDFAVFFPELQEHVRISEGR